MTISSPAVSSEPKPLRLRLRWALYPGIALGLVLAIGLVGASALLATHNAEALRRVSRTQDTRTALSILLSAVEGAETGQRGFLLTRKDSYLDPYRQGEHDVPAGLDALDASLAERASPQVRAALAELRTAAGDKMTELAETVKAAQEGRWEAATDIVQSDRGQRSMTRIRAIIGQLETEEQASLADQVLEVNRAGRLLVLADAAWSCCLRSPARSSGAGGRRSMCCAPPRRSWRWPTMPCPARTRPWRSGCVSARPP